MYSTRPFTGFDTPSRLRRMARTAAVALFGCATWFGGQAVAQSNPAPFDLSSGSFSFTEWAATEAAGTYPANMFFHRTGTQDPVLATATTSDWTGAYNLTSGSRVIGLGATGFSFINTGTSGNLGAAVGGLNASGRQNIAVSWTGGTVAATAGARVYAIRLQYRIGSGSFVDVPGPVEYIVSTAGNSESFGPTVLPAACDGQAELYLRWMYYYISGSGARPQMRVDDITVSSSPASASPTLSTTPLAAFGEVCQDLEVGPNTFVVSGFNLTGDVSVGPFTGFTFSTDDVTYTGSLTLVPDAGNAISQTVFVKFLPTTAPTDFGGDIPVNGGGAPDADVSVVASSLSVGVSTLITGGRVSLSGNLLTLFSRLVDENCGTVSEYGIEWSTTEGFTPGSGTQVASSNWASTTTGLFSADVDIAALCAGSSLYFRAYAVNSAGTAHGAEVAYGLQRSAISQWTFDLNETTPSTGTGTAALIGGTTATFAGGNPGQAWNVAGFPAQSTASGTAGVSFLVPTTDHSGIVLTLDHRVSGTASRWFQVDYTLNGGSSWVSDFWNNNGAAFDGQFYTYNVDFSSVTGANNNPDFGVRIVSIFAKAPFDENLTASFDADVAYQRGNAGSRTPGNGLTTGAYASSGLWRLDNVTISGNSANPPATQDSEITFSNILTNGFDINWTNGDGAGRIVVLNTSNSFTDPVDGTDPVADANYAGGEQVVYNGSGSTVGVSGLNEGTTYWARVYGYFGSCDNTVFSTATASNNPNSQATTSATPPTKLVVADINGGNVLVQDLPFTITVESQDASNIPQTVSQDTEVEVTVLSGSGNLGATTTATILAGTSSVQITGLEYDTEDFGVIFEIAVTSGDALDAVETVELDFLSPAQELAFGTIATAAIINEILPAFSVEAVRSDFSVAVEFTGAVTLSIFSGTGNLVGTLTQNAVAGVATFNDIAFDAADTYILQAGTVGLSDGFSGQIIITNVPTVTELVIPQFIGSKSAAGSNNNRTPIVACVQFDELIPNTVYKIQAGIGLTTDVATSLGAGNVWDGTAYSGSQIASAFTSDANGSSGPYWLFMESTGNASRFGAGQVHDLRLRFVPQSDVFGDVQFISTSTFTALDIAPTELTPATTDDGAYLLGTTAECMGGNFVLAYDNEAGTGAPLSVFQVRNTIPTSAAGSQTGNPAAIADVFTQGGASTEGQYALIIPIGANNSNGVRRLELRDAQNVLVAAITDADGVWPGGANTTTNTRRSVSEIGSGDAILAPDADGDNIADCDDNCPNLPGVQGDACDDGDPLTVNDIINGDCVCVGQSEDCEGTPGGPAVTGTPCDDGDATTGNDTWDANCVCIGELIDCLGVAGGSALPGTPCDDGDAATFNDVYLSDCTCAGTIFEFGAGNLVVLQAETSVNNTTATLVELQASANNATPVAALEVPGTGADAIRISGSASSTGYVSRTDDRTLLSFNGHNSAAGGNANTLNPRAVVTVAPNGVLNIATTYTGNSGNQTRSSTSLDNTNWFIADQGGLFTNASTSADPAGNLRAIKSFGGVVYVGRASSTAGITEVSTVSAPSSATITGLSGLSNNGAHQDFYLVQSGVNNDQHDVLYVISATSNTVGTISKYSLVDASWEANGSYSTGVGGFGLTAEVTGTTTQLYLTTGLGALTANDVLRLTDVAGYNETIDIDALNILTVYTAPAGKILKGVDFAPQPCVAPAVVSVTSNSPVCSSDDLELSVTATGSGTLAYSWTGAGTFAPNNTSSSVSVTDGTTGIYSVTVTNACGNDAGTVSVTITPATTWYEDQDGDGFGDPNSSVEACDQPAGYVANSDDTCPVTPGVIGSYCDVLDPDESQFQLGQLDASCDCVPVPTDFNVVLEMLTPDGSSDEISWEIELVSANLTICSGGSYPAGIAFPITVSCGLVDNECYRLRVFDSMGDGFGTGGGYQLRLTGSDPADLRVIDNTGNFTIGAESAIGNGPSTFCFPMSTQKPIFVARDKMDWVSNEFFVCEPDAAVSAEWIPGGPNSVQSSTTGYQFWFFDSNGTYSFRRGRYHNTSDGFGPANEFRACHMRINNWAVANQIPANVLMNVRVRTRVNSVYGAFGPAYRFMIDPVAAACPLTKLNDIPDQPALSCNSNRNWGPGNFVHARQVSGANRYQFRFRIPAEGYIKVVSSNTYFLQLNWATAPLEPGKTYEVQVRASKDGGATWCASGAVWGPSCTLTINDLAQAGEQNLGLGNSNSGSLAMWPNPNRGDQLWIDLNGIEAGVESVAVDIMDMTGKQIVARILPTQGDRLNTVLNLNGDLATGMYLVNITAGDKRYTERLVIAN